MPDRLLLFLVGLCSPPFAALSYSLPPWLPPEAFAVGQRVAVPLGNGLRAGVILSMNQARDAAPDSPLPSSGTGEPGAAQTPDAEKTRSFALKPLFWPLEKAPLLSESYLELARQLALRQTAHIGQILGNLLPAGLRTTQARIRFFAAGTPCEYKVRALYDLPPETLRELGRLWMSGQAGVLGGGQNPRDAELCLLAADPPWPVRPAAKAQIALLEYLFERGVITRRALGKALGSGAAKTLTLLAKRGLVHIRPPGGCERAASRAGHEENQTESFSPLSASDPALKPASDADPDAARGVDLRAISGVISGTSAGRATLRTAHEADPAEETLFPLPPIAPSAFGPRGNAADPQGGFRLTPHQLSVFDPLLKAIQGGKAETRLLFGITGSGKTAVYLELARAVLARGRSVLLLAPEVALALKLWADAAVALPLATRRLFHGYQPAGMKEATFRLLAEAGKQDPCVVVGTRSALLLPLENIGLIILDEEHDSSFKQDEGFTYQAKEVAWYRAGRENALLLLGSATPDVKSYHAAVAGKIPLHTLTERVGGSVLPEVRLVSLPKGQTNGGPLTPESAEALVSTVRRGEQAVILLNRRGYAPLMYCLGCASVVKCPHCDIGLAYHKGRERLLCHYCGYTLAFPSPCSCCKGMRFLPMGEGTEKLEEHLAATLPSGAGVLRLDRDSTRRPGRMEEILSAFARKEASVLVGTQMLSKGHHFPDVTLAIVVDADLGLNLPDYRAAERTFQLLLQSAGRSGRGEKAGAVIIQTRDPSHYCWEYVRTADYEGFFARELALRQKRLYPPFVHLALIRISYAMDDAKGADEVTTLGTALRAKGRELGLTVLGPAPAPLPFLKGRRRFHCLVKGQDWQILRALYAAALTSAKHGRLRVRLDLDPVNML